MVVDQDLNLALNRIADAIEENGETLKRIADHYDGVVPVMARNAKRVEKAHIESESEGDESPFSLRGMFSPKAN